MSLWEFSSCVTGYNKSQGGEEAIKPLSVEEHDRLMQKHG